MKVIQFIGFVCVLAAGTSAVQATELSTYETRYEVQRGGSNYGEALRRVSLNDGTYSLYTETEISLLFLSDRRRFWSEFTVDNGQVKSNTFDYKRSGTGRNKGFSGTFDHANKVIINNESKQTLPLDASKYAMDEAASIEQLRLDLQHSKNDSFVYYVLDEKGQAEELTFRRAGTEQLQLPYGAVEAIKVERVRENSSRETDYWFAPDLDYVLVKMAQREDGDEVATLQLSHIN